MAPIQLQDDQKFALMKFRRSVHDILQPQHDDQFLLRWLRARNWNPEAAEKMLRDSMEWRKRWEIDTTLKTWQAPEVLLKYYPSGQAGFDKEGCPIIILPFVGLDVWGLLHTISKHDIIRQTIIVLENYLDMAQTNGTHQVILVVDMEGFNLRQYAWKPAVELVISFLQMYEGNYPEILKSCYIINAPSVFSLAFNFVKKFMGEYTVQKIQIYKTDPKKWQPILRANLSVKDLPKHYGGDLVDPDGDPRCPSKIKLGGKVPKSFYNNKQKLDDTKHEYKTDIVKKGKQLCLDYIVAEEGCVLRWDFRTDDHDIKFGLTCRNEEGIESVVIPLHRVNCQDINEVGVINCDYPATYTVIFDNTYSMLRSKKVLHNIQLSIPIEKLNITTLPDDEPATETADTAL